jgi:hypothetical protein
MNNPCPNETHWPRPRPGRFWIALVALALAAALTAACNGGGGGGPPTAAPSGQALASAACEALGSLKSYRYVSNVALQSPEPTATPAAQATPSSTITRQFAGPFEFTYNTDASFVAPDRFEADITGSTSPLSIIAIGENAWVRIGQAWQQSASTITYKPSDICQAFLAILDLSQVQPQEEKVDDVKALHYTFSQTPAQDAIAKTFGAGSDMEVLLELLDVDVWLQEKDLWPVRIEVQSSGFYGDGRELRAHILVELRDVNDEDIKVEPPA